jgi:hypothetical protein
MFSWLARVFYKKRINRLEKLTKCFEYFGNGNFRAVQKTLIELKPTEYLDDLSLYYFIKGRLALETLEIEKGEFYLTTAWTLGFKKVPLYVSLGLAKARLRRYNEAKELLYIAQQLSSDEDEIINGLLDLMDRISHGLGEKQINKNLTKASKKFVNKSRIKDLKERDFNILFEKILDEKMDDTLKMGNDDILYLDLAIPALGEYLKQKFNGVWEFGLELMDHAVLINGIAIRPYHLIIAYKKGQIKIEDFSKVLEFKNLSQIFFEEEGMDVSII